MDGAIIENDAKTVAWMENILSVFGAKTPCSNFFRNSVHVVKALHRER